MPPTPRFPWSTIIAIIIELKWVSQSCLGDSGEDKSDFEGGQKSVKTSDSDCNIDDAFLMKLAKVANVIRK